MNSGKLVFLAPYPSHDRYFDGWMSRIKTIDEALDRYPRIYLDFQADYRPPEEPQKVFESVRVEAYRLSPEVARHRAFAASVLNDARFVYVHTMHQGEHILPYFDPERMLIDIHGIVPEEELMLGSRERSQFFGEVEREIVQKARHMLVVTSAMERHLATKYPGSHKPLHLPVYDFGAADLTRDSLSELFATRAHSPKDVCVYAGGTQVWQCVDEMLELIKVTSNLNDHELYSHDEQHIKSLLLKHGLSSELFGGYIGKDVLRTVYGRSTFGFAIRKESPVNRVASPTKLCDYCAAGVIPIVDFSEIGDFEDYGYAYVRASEYAEGYIPDRTTQKWMIENNLSCMDVMRSEFVHGIQKLHDLIGSKFD